MDPHIETEQPGHSLEARKAEEGVDYLRRLKTQSCDDAPCGTASRVVAPAEPSSGFKERRRSPRLRCSGSAEFWPEGSDVRMWGTLTDVSLHGCYVEMSNTFPVGTRVSLNLESLGVRVRVQATVRVSYPFLGMGMCFAEIEPGQRLQLEQLLAALSGQSSVSNSVSAAAQFGDSTHAQSEVDSKAMLDELTQFFRSNQLLSREEFYQIVKRARG